MFKLLQFGNHKLPKSIGIFNLPQGLTCPGITKYCKKNCYSKKASRLYTAVDPYRKKMWNLTKQPKFAVMMTNYIKKISKKIIRIHESGDFYRQKYLDDWITIAQNCEDIKFYSYTKSYMFDFNKRSQNFIVRLSIDKTSTYNALKKIGSFDGIAETIEVNEPSDIFVCPGSCKTCDYCLTSGDVAFERH